MAITSMMTWRTARSSSGRLASSTTTLMPPRCAAPFLPRQPARKPELSRTVITGRLPSLHCARSRRYNPTGATGGPRFLPQTALSAIFRPKAAVVALRDRSLALLRTLDPSNLRADTTASSAAQLQPERDDLAPAPCCPTTRWHATPGERPHRDHPATRPHGQGCAPQNAAGAVNEDLGFPDGIFGRGRGLSVAAGQPIISGLEHPGRGPALRRIPGQSRTPRCQTRGGQGWRARSAAVRQPPRHRPRPAR
jgi:hypothetical protein